MEIILNRIYSFDENIDDGTPCIKECGNRFKLSQIVVNENIPFDSTEVRFLFFCENCGREFMQNVVFEKERIHPIQDKGNYTAGIHISFFSNVQLNFRYVDEEKKLIKKSINPNRIFRDRKRMSFSSFSSSDKYRPRPSEKISGGWIRTEKIKERKITADGAPTNVVIEYIKKDTMSLMDEGKSSFTKDSTAKDARKLQEIYEKKYKALAEQYQRPEDANKKSKELEIDLSIPEEDKVGWKTGKIDWSQDLQPVKGMEPQQEKAKEIGGYTASEWMIDELDDFYDNDTSTR